MNKFETKPIALCEQRRVAKYIGDEEPLLEKASEKSLTRDDYGCVCLSESHLKSQKRRHIFKGSGYLCAIQLDLHMACVTKTTLDIIHDNEIYENVFSFISRRA